MKGKKARIIKSKVRKAVRTAKRTPKRKLNKMFGIVAGKLVAVTMQKNKFKKKRRYSKRRRY